MRTLLQEKNS